MRRLAFNASLHKQIDSLPNVTTCELWKSGNINATYVLVALVFYLALEARVKVLDERLVVSSRHHDLQAVSHGETIHNPKQTTEHQKFLANGYRTTVTIDMLRHKYQLLEVGALI